MNETQKAKPYETILSNDHGEISILVPQFGTDTGRLAARACADHTGLADFDDSTPEAVTWLADMGEENIFRQHTTDPDEVGCNCEDVGWWCPQGDGQEGSFLTFRASEIEEAGRRAISESAREVSA